MEVWSNWPVFLDGLWLIARIWAGTILLVGLPVLLGAWWWLRTHGTDRRPF